MIQGAATGVGTSNHHLILLNRLGAARALDGAVATRIHGDLRQPFGAKETVEGDRRAIGPHHDFVTVAQKANPEDQGPSIDLNTCLLPRQQRPLLLGPVVASHEQGERNQIVVAPVAVLE